MNQKERDDLTNFLAREVRKQQRLGLSTWKAISLTLKAYFKAKEEPKPKPKFKTKKHKEFDEWVVKVHRRKEALVAEGICESLAMGTAINEQNQKDNDNKSNQPT